MIIILYNKYLADFSVYLLNMTLSTEDRQMIQPTHWTLAELAEQSLLWGLQVRTLPSDQREEALRQSLAILRRFSDRAEETDHSEEAINAAHLALCAYLDEKWLGNLPLDLSRSLHGEPAAPRKFFELLHETEGDFHLHSARQVFLLCMVFGFEGEYKDRTGERADEMLLREAEAIWEESVAHAGIGRN